MIRTITQELDSASVPYFMDPIKNLVIGVSSQAEYLRLLKKRDPEPVRIFIAHMDHPGFHGLSWKEPQELEIKWHGGSPTQHLEGARVWIAGASGWIGEGRLKNPQLTPSKKALDTATVFLPVETCEKISQGKLRLSSLYGGFSFRSPWWQEDKLIYTKAADDLVGSFAIASIALELWGKKRRSQSAPPFLGLLTRAEEVGFIGALGHLNLGWMRSSQRQIVCISLETSRTLPGAEIGKGPVVRLGDRFTVFSSGSLQVLSKVAQLNLANNHQRRIMDGGTCEASATSVFGYNSIGISIPLGNYHNQNFEGGSDSGLLHGPAPEFVHTDDIEGLLKLCQGLLKPHLSWSDPWKEKRKELNQGLKSYAKLLQTLP